MFFKKILLFVYISASTLFLVNCNDDNPASSFNELLSDWLLVKITFESDAMSFEFTAEELDYSMILKIKGDHTYQILIDGEISEEGTWNVSGNTITYVSSEGYTQAMNYTVSSNKLVLTFTTEDEEPPVGPPSAPSKTMKILTESTVTMEFAKAG